VLLEKLSSDQSCDRRRVFLENERFRPDYGGQVLAKKV
jgi:hypothetical protein